MKKEELKQILKNKKGYFNNNRLRKGIKWLSNHYNVSTDLIIEVANELKNNDNGKVKSVKIQSPKLQFSDRVTNSINNRITKPGTYWITGCSHAPFQNKKMYESTINYLNQEVDLSGIILAGDIIDANSISFHDKGNIAIPGVTLEWEYKESNKFLDQLDAINLNNKDHKFFIYGNHEDRYNRLVRQNDNSKYGSALLSPEEGLKLEKRGYKVFKDWKNDCVQIGKYLDVNHGEFFNVHTAKKTIDTYRKSTLYFHTHRYQIFMEGQVAGFNMGFGGDIKAPVFGFASRAMKSSWVNGSALVTLDSDGLYHVESLLFINNKLVVNGREY